MDKREKVIKGLECLSDTTEAIWPTKERCENCPWGDSFLNDFGFETWACRSIDCAKDALALLKAQEPRVMTLKEMQKIASIRDGAIWLEAGAGLMPAFMEFATRDITSFVAIPFTSYRQFFENDWYGKTWRCWTSRPTDAQREATPWEAVTS